MRFLLVIMWCVHFLPLPILGRLGELVGYIAYWLIPHRRLITLANLRLCFPHLSENERQLLAIQHFKAYARSILERGILWWGSEKRIASYIELDGASLLNELTGPIIFLCPHFVYLEVINVALALKKPMLLCSIYAPQKNIAFDKVLKKGRLRFNPLLFPRAAGIKPIIRAMNQGYRFLMFPDMDFGIGNAIFTPFFGVPAATLTAPARLALATGAKVIPIVATSLPNYQGWRITVHPMWTNFPGEDIAAATRQMNVFIEQAVAHAPAEYFWTHRRFKTRPIGEKSVYE